MLEERERGALFYARQREHSGLEPQELCPLPRGGNRDIFVVVCAWVGKEFPDMRQNKREIKFIRVGDAVRTAGQLKGESMLNRGL